MSIPPPPRLYEVCTPDEKLRRLRYTKARMRTSRFLMAALDGVVFGVGYWPLATHFSQHPTFFLIGVAYALGNFVGKWL